MYRNVHIHDYQLKSLSVSWSGRILLRVKITKPSCTYHVTCRLVSCNNGMKTVWCWDTWGFQRFPVYLTQVTVPFYQPCNHVMKTMTLYEYDVETNHSCGAFKDPYSTSLYCVTMVIMVWKLWMLRHTVPVAFKDLYSTSLYRVTMVIMVWKLWCRDAYRSCGAFKDPHSAGLYCVTMVIMVWKLWCRDTYCSCGAFKDPHSAGLQTVVQLLHEPFLDVVRLKGEWKLVWNSFTFSLWKWKVDYIIHVSQCLLLYL